ncbi:hypothetical protein ELI_4106 [Eubacterium callanderi]|uniref:Uncharacterized protein n=1 Tax=Eubacterium callanderi TaxID=53442 RepID=E3GPZ9_9FIRM|nr:hypothetical protein ELI_4106 [Eubacterium callanderi]
MGFLLSDVNLKINRNIIYLFVVKYNVNILKYKRIFCKRSTVQPKKYCQWQYFHQTV